jgi:hypothetical protein
MLRTNLSAWALRFGERGGNFTDSTPTPASRLKNQDSIDRVGGLAPDLTHPQAVGGGGDPRDLDLTRRQIEEEQDHEALQSFSRPHFHGEKIGRHDPFPVSREKLFPGRLPTALGCGFEAMPCEDGSNGAASQLVSEMGQGTLQAPIAPSAILFGQANHQGFYVWHRTRTSGSALATAIVFLGNEFPMPSQ